MRETGASDTTTSFSYDTSSSMTLGAAVSYTSANAGFSANGTTTRTSGGFYTFKNLTGAGNNHLQGDGVYDKWENYCVNIGTNNVYVWNLQQSGVASEYTVATPGTPAISVGKCITSAAGSPNKFSVGTQQTFSAGAQLSVAGYGINVSSQDGFTQNSTLTYTFSAQWASDMRLGRLSWHRRIHRRDRRGKWVYVGHPGRSRS
jgi:hypothetical protein